MIKIELLFNFLLKNIFLHYQTFIVKNKSLMVIDLAPSIKHKDVLQYMSNNDINFVF